MNEVSWSSGPTCLSVKVSRESKRGEGALAAARHPTGRWVRFGRAERASLSADAERRAAMGGDGGKRRRPDKRRDIGARYSPSQVRHRVDYAFVRPVSGLTRITSVTCNAVMSVTWLVHACFQSVAAAVDVDEEDGDAHDAQWDPIHARGRYVHLKHGKKNFSIWQLPFVDYLSELATRDPHVDQRLS